MNNTNRLPTRREFFAVVGGASFTAISGCGALGGGGDAEFEVSIVEANDPVQSGGVLEATVVVDNVGDSAGRQEIRFSAGEMEDSTEVSLDSGASTEVTFNARVETDQREETIDATVESSGFSDLQRITVQRASQYELAILDITDDVVRGETLRAEVEVTNTGGIRDTKTVRLGSPGLTDALDSMDVTVGGGSSETVTLTWDVDDETSFGQISVTTEDDQVIQTVSLLDPAQLELIVQGTNAPVLDGESLEVDVRVANQGGVEVTETVSMEFNGDEVASESVTLEGGRQQTVTLSHETTLDDAGDNDVLVTLRDSSETTSVTVEEAIAIVESRVEETPEDFAELIEVTIENKRSEDETVVIDGEIEHEEFTDSVAFQSGTYEATLPAGTNTNERPVTVSAESTETYYLKIITDIWEFGGTTKIPLGAEISVNYEHEASLRRNPEELPTMEPHELVAVMERDSDWDFNAGTTILTATIENLSTERVNVETVAFVPTLEGDEDPVSNTEEFTLAANQDESIEEELRWGSLTFAGNEYLEIAGVRDEPGTDPGLSELVDN